MGRVRLGRRDDVEEMLMSREGSSDAERQGDMSSSTCSQMPETSCHLPIWSRRKSDGQLLACVLLVY